MKKWRLWIDSRSPSSSFNFIVLPKSFFYARFMCENQSNKKSIYQNAIQPHMSHMLVGILVMSKHLHIFFSFRVWILSCTERSFISLFGAFFLLLICYKRCTNWQTNPRVCFCERFPCHTPQKLSVWWYVCVLGLLTIHDENMRASEPERGKKSIIANIFGLIGEGEWFAPSFSTRICNFSFYLCETIFFYISRVLFIVFFQLE